MLKNTCKFRTRLSVLYDMTVRTGNIVIRDLRWSFVYLHVYLCECVCVCV